MNRINNNFNNNKIEIEKENITPSKFVLPNNDHSLINLNLNIKEISNKKKELINILEVTEEQSIKLLNKKEELAYEIVIRDNQIFKEQAELDYIEMVSKGIENQKMMHDENSKLNNYSQLNTYLSLLYEDNNSYNNNNNNNNQFKIKLKNNYYITYSKTQKDHFSLSGIYNDANNIGNLNEILEKNLEKDPDLMLYYANFNII